MAEDGKRFGAFSGGREHGHFADYPKRSQYVVGMTVGDEHAVELFKGDSCLFHLGKDSVASAGIHQEMAVVAGNCKTGVVAFGYHGVAGTEKCDRYLVSHLSLLFAKLRRIDGRMNCFKVF